MPPKSTASILGTLIVYSDIPGFTKLTGVIESAAPEAAPQEKVPFLFFVCTAPRFSLVLALTLGVGCPQASVPCPDGSGLKQRLIRGLLLTQVGEREGYSSHSWNAGRACGGRGWHDIAAA